MIWSQHQGCHSGTSIVALVQSENSKLYSSRPPPWLVPVAGTLPFFSHRSRELALIGASALKAFHQIGMARGRGLSSQQIFFTWALWLLPFGGLGSLFILVVGVVIAFWQLDQDVIASKMLESSILVFRIQTKHLV